MRLMKWELRVVPRRTIVRFLKPVDEPRTRVATQRFTFGNVQANIYAPFDDRSGKTAWRFSLIKLMEEEGSGETVYRRSFGLDDVDDLRMAVERCAAYIDRAKEL
jgi:hypothetical protein